MENANVMFNAGRLSYSAELMRAVAHPLRLKILEFIDQQGSTHVNNIYNTLKLEQSITSQHLRILKLAGVVNDRRDGKFIIYNIDYDVIERIDIGMRNFLRTEALIRAKA